MLAFLVSLCALTIAVSVTSDEVHRVTRDEPHNIHHHTRKWRQQHVPVKQSHCSGRDGDCATHSKRSGCVSGVERIAVFISNITVPTSSVAAQIGDTDHLRSTNVSRGMYSKKYWRLFDMRAMLYIARLLGPNFNYLGQVYIPGLAGIGGWVSVTGKTILVPYVIGLNESLPGNDKYFYFIGYDSANPDQDEWRLLVSGLVAIVLGNTTSYVDTPEGRFFGNNAIGYSNFAQVNLQCRRWDINDPECVVNNLILPPSNSLAITAVPWSVEYPTVSGSFTPLIWENACCQRGTGNIAVWLSASNGYVGDVRKYQTTTLILPTQGC